MMSSCCASCFSGLHRQSAKVSAQRNKTKHVDSYREVVHQEAAELRNFLRDDVREYFAASCPLTNQEEKWMTDEILGIYVRARASREARLQILVPALEWRICNRETLNSRECTYCVANPLSHDARLFGFDSERDFVFMNCFELPRDIAADSVIRHMTCLLERALNEYPTSVKFPLEDDGHPHVRRWTFIFDLYGFGLRYYDPRVTMRLLELFQVVHRGRLKKLFVLDAPYGFGSFWQIVRPLLKEETASKLEFSDWKTIRSRFEEQFGFSLTEELWQEAMENRNPQMVASKRWTTFYGRSIHQARREELFSYDNGDRTCTVLGA
mmetsp:Transcript_6103/g.9894  ORF Transcript_6103/g.9894 Transcript_6103/m.9894 type:complete len:324 (-) Transcript_6103:45-1016(-)